jgi:light-regulated signal transduction histidine kinase (bacteriophytochrome)
MMNRKSRILILLDQESDYKLLSVLLEKNYEIINSEKFPDVSLKFDLVIIDGITHNRYRTLLTDEKARINPLFLPVLLLTGKKDVDIASGFLWKTVDEMIVLPVNKTELQARVEILLRTRKLTMELENSHSRVIQRTSQLEAVNKELEAFSYSVSHDLRAPLRHINSFAEILTTQYSGTLSKEGLKHLRAITESAKKMGTLIDDLLSFSRTGRAELKKSTFNMNHVIEDALAQIKPSFKDRKISWKISSLPDIHGDYIMLRLVWVNLLDNAVKYTKNKEKTIIQIACKEGKKEFEFSIKDNGVGFEMKYADKLFGVFQRLHSSAQFDGTGIGLANVKRIILRHGGRVWAEADIDKGATFYFSIPK